jgi:large subunit ribosomal protein L5
MSKLQENFNKIIIPELQKELGIKNALAIPKLTKIVINSGIGKLTKDKNLVASAVEGLSLITGQKPITTKAKVAISSFKIREGMPVGLKITLRGKRMYDFTDKLVKVVLPRMRDFKGISEKSLDQGGCLTIGFTEIVAFPEIAKQQQNRAEYNFGFEITFVTKAKKREYALALYKKLGLIFKKETV